MHVIMTNSLVYYNLSFDKNGDAIITVPASMRKQYIWLFKENYIEADFGKDFGLGEIILRYKLNLLPHTRHAIFGI